MTKKGIICCVLSVLLAGYLVFALIVSQDFARGADCRGVAIHVQENALSRFVTADDIDAELHGLRGRADSIKAGRVPLQLIENTLNALPNIESANATRRANDSIYIDVVPMQPVARVFDPSGSYYINRAGKRLTANTQYQIDVPVVIRETESVDEAVVTVDLLDRIAANPAWNDLVSSVMIDRNNDILLIPAIGGHVVKFGDTGSVDDKFERLFAFYRKVLPVKGWNYYDTISVKYGHQVIGKIAPGAKTPVVNPHSNEDIEEIDDAGTMETDSVTLNFIKPKI